MTAGRIAIFLHSLLPWAGVERLAVSQAREFLKHGYEVDFVFLDEPQPVGDSLPQGCRSFNLGVPRLRGGLKPLVEYILAERPDAIHAAMWPLSTLAVLAHRLARSSARLVISDHNPLSVQYARRSRSYRLAMRLVMAITYPLAHARVAVSEGVAKDLSRLTCLPLKMFTVIYNPVPLEDFGGSSQQEAERWWGDWKGKRILTVGRMKSQKNHGLLIAAFKRLIATTDARLMMIGVGELKQALSDRIYAEGLSDHVVMPGQVEDPIPYYKSADLFVLTSDYEGFGNVIVEALACGVPVVSTDCPGGPAEILEAGRYGRLVPVRDEVALAAAMAAALAEPADVETLKLRARDFMPGPLAERYLSLLFPRRGEASTLSIDPQKTQHD